MHAQLVRDTGEGSYTGERFSSSFCVWSEGVTRFCLQFQTETGFPQTETTSIKLKLLYYKLEMAPNRICQTGTEFLQTETVSPQTETDFLQIENDAKQNMSN